jgi:Domain of unknown function (DUF5671)
VTNSSSGDLNDYIKHAKEQSVPDASIVALLKYSGWSERRIYRSLATYYTETLGIVVPGRSSRSDSARDAFLYLLNFITLGFWSTAIGNLCYVLIGRAFPDRTISYQYQYSGSLMTQIAWQLAATIIALPAFLAINQIIERELTRRPELADSPVRAWLTYAALVISATIVLIDAIWVLESLLKGELTIRFVLDSLVLLVLGGGVFIYYYTGLKPAKNDA